MLAVTVVMQLVVSKAPKMRVEVAAQKETEVKTV
jgi:hypothetical protein